MPFHDTEVIRGYENFQKRILALEKETENRSLLILFEADEVDGVSWCPDCEKFKIMWKEFKRAKKLPESGYLVHVKVGTALEWIGNIENPFRTDTRLHLETVPTLMRWGTQKRLRGNAIFSVSKILNLMEEPDRISRVSYF